MRLYLLARELGTDSKSLIALLKDKGYEVTNHMKNLSDEEIACARDSFKAEEAVKPETKKSSSKKTETQKDKKEKVEKAEKKSKSSTAEAETDESPSLDPEKKEELLQKIRNLKGKKKGKRALKATQHEVEELEPAPLLEEEDDFEEEEEFRAEDQKIRRRRRADEDAAAKLKVEEELKKKKQAKQEDSRPRIQIPPQLAPKELADLLGKSVNEVVQKVMALGIMSLNQKLDYDTSSLIAEDFGFSPTTEEVIEIEIDEPEEDPTELEGRPPVVTVMGHVDHGKTTLLDAIRNTNVVASESGGITQHIGAYRVHLKSGKFVTFIDTPGHEAFTAMRAHGANVTDIAVLVVAADDGVQPQTVEAIDHARAAGVPIIVAINKIDRPSVNFDRIMKQLADNGLTPEEWGGTTVMVKLSALKRTGVSELIEMVELMAEMKDLKASPHKPGRGVIVESFLDKGRGPVATVLVQNGTLRIGDAVVIGPIWGRIRSMLDENSQKVKSAGPSYPVEIFGLSGVPAAGDRLKVVKDEKAAREQAGLIEQKQRQKAIEKDTPAPVTDFNDLFARLQEDECQSLNVVIKTDVDGSITAVKHSLQGLSNDKVKISVIHGSVGAVTENDIMLASASSALVLAFRVRATGAVTRLASQESVTIKHYKIIYEMIDDVKKAMQGMIAPEIKESVLGHAQVRQLFKISKLGTIAGSYVEDGKIAKNATARVIRDGVTIYEGKVSSLKRFQDDVSEVSTGQDCGIGVEKFNDIKVGDVIEFFRLEQVTS